MRQLVIINLRELIHLKKMLHQKILEMTEMSQLKGSKDEENQKLTLKLQKAIRSYEKKLVAMEQKTGEISKSASESNVQAPPGWAIHIVLTKITF